MPKRAPVLAKYLRDLESSDALSTEQSSIPQFRRGRASRDADLGFLVVLKIVRFLALIFMMLLGDS